MRVRGGVEGREREWQGRAELATETSLPTEEAPELLSVSSANGLPWRAMMSGPLSTDVLLSCARSCRHAHHSSAASSRVVQRHWGGLLA